MTTKEVDMKSLKFAVFNNPKKVMSAKLHRLISDKTGFLIENKQDVSRLTYLNALTGEPAKEVKKYCEAIFPKTTYEQVIEPKFS